MNSSIIDISVPLREGMIRWPGSVPFNHTWTKSFKMSDGVNVSMISSDLHIGTHVDAPLHYVDGGTSVDQLELDVLCGTVQLIDISGATSVTADLLAGAGIWPETERLLLKTNNSSFWQSDLFHTDYVALTRDAAKLLVEKGIRLFGVDYLSVQRYADPPDVHRILLENGVVLVEGLDLSSATPGSYEIICLPLRIVGAEGAPARVVLRQLR